MPRVTQTLASAWVLSKAKALGIANSEMQTLGLRIPASLANSATIRCKRGYSFSETYLNLIIRDTNEGPIKYWSNIKPTAITA